MRMLDSVTLIQAAVESVFPGSAVSITTDYIDITLDDCERLKFQDLNRLSDVLGTDRIDLVKGKHHEGYWYSSWTNADSYDDPQYIRVYRNEV